MVSKKNIHHIWAGVIVSLFSFSLLTSCGESDPVVASIGDRELHESEAIAIMDYLGLDHRKDKIFEEFVQSWAEKTLYEVELEERFPENWKLIELRSSSFRSDLARYELEELELASKLDTTISDEEISAYYEEHKEEFVLTDYLVRALYLKIPAEADYKKKDIQQKYLLKKNKDLDEINSYAKLYAENFYFNDSAWVYFSELTKDMPLSRMNRDNVVLNRTKTYFTEGDFTYFLNIFDYQLKDEVPTLDFLKEDIKNIILNQRTHSEKEKLGPELLKKLKRKYEIQLHF